MIILLLEYSVIVTPADCTPSGYSVDVDDIYNAPVHDMTSRFGEAGVYRQPLLLLPGVGC